MTRYEAFIEKSWRDSGMAHLVVARIRDDGRADVGVFLVDLWCLGVKDAFLLDDGSEAGFQELVRERLPEQYRERFHPACAKKMIEGAIAFAEQLGFAPHRDFRKARRALSGLEASACPETFTYGRDGKPFYLEGPSDTPERTERVLSMLEARCGKDGFDYELMAEEDEDDDIRIALMVFFAEEPEGSPTFFEFSGMVTALQVCPVVMPPTKLLEKLWGPDGRVWSGEDELKGFYEDLSIYWNYVADIIDACVQAPPGTEDVDPIDIHLDDFEDGDTPMAGAFVHWCRGFLRTTREWPEAWSTALTREDLADAWKVMRAWADPSTPENLAIVTQGGSGVPEAQRGRTLPQAASDIVRALRPAPPATPLDG